MAATQHMIEVEQMKLVLQEMNTHPEARLFFALQERGACGGPADSGNSVAKTTLRIVTEKVNKHLYPSLSAFIDDISMIFSACPLNTPLASGAVALRELFSEVLAKYTNPYPGYSTTPPGKKKRPRHLGLPSFMEDDDPFGDIDIDGFDEFGSIADEGFGEDILHSEDKAALLELTEEIASIEAEIQLLKDTKQDLHKDSSNPGYSSHSSGLDALKSSSGGLYSSSEEEGRVALSESKKRSRRNSTAKSRAEDVSPNRTDKTRRPSVTTRSKQKQEFQTEIMTKEQLLWTITHDLPHKFLEGVIRIVNPMFDSATATEEDLEFDINLLDDDVLARLQQYVNTCLRSPQKRKVSRPQTKVTHRKESPKKRLQKEAPKKVNRKRTATGSRKRSTVTQNYSTAASSKKKKQQTLLAATLSTRNTFVSAEVMKQVFMKEEIVRVEKSEDGEDEDVDIMD